MQLRYPIMRTHEGRVLVLLVTTGSRGSAGQPVELRECFIVNWFTIVASMTPMR